jgi:hypothetical protein
MNCHGPLRSGRTEKLRQIVGADLHVRRQRRRWSRLADGNAGAASAGAATMKRYRLLGITADARRTDVASTDATLSTFRTFIIMIASSIFGSFAGSEASALRRLREPPLAALVRAEKV